MTESVADRHRRLADAFHTIVEAVPANRLAEPTPCDGWTISDVIDHVTTTQGDFLGQRGLEVPADASPKEVSAAIQAALEDPTTAEATYDSYFGPTTINDTIDAFYCLDLVLHRWDIAAAAGLEDDCLTSDADIARCRSLMAPMGDNIRMPGIFGPELQAADDASPTDRFVAWAGRRTQPS